MVHATPRVSVCMPASRETRWFADALRSVLAQSHRDLEVVVTDDSGGSLANAVARVGDARVRYVPNPTRLGFAGNHCRALDEARGAYVTFLHDDDAWEPEYLASAVQVMDDCPTVGIVLAGATEIDGAGKVIGPRPARIPGGLVTRPLHLMLDPSFMLLLPSLTMVRRSALSANERPWPDVIASDLTLYVDIARAGWLFYYLDRPLVRYRVHPGQIGADELAHRHALVTIWSRYVFADAEAERLRRRVVARALVGRAASLLRRREPRRAWADLVAARSISPATARRRRIALGLMSWLPSSLVPLSSAMWALVARRHRHEGV